MRSGSAKEFSKANGKERWLIRARYCVMLEAEADE